MASNRNDIKITDEPLWYKDAIIYEVHVKSFFDNNDDGIGDFRGLLQKLDYLEDLGITAIWLLPFYPSPLRDDGYDISDYFNINPDYGDRRTFKRFLREAHKRGIRVITELVINHTSDQHHWFQRARRAKRGSVWRDFYVWSDTPNRYNDARIIFQDFENSNWSWDPVANAYYWHRFYHHQPDLNYDNPRVRKEIYRVVDFWFSMGIDGLRLDAVPYLIEREGTNCENLSETHEVLKELRSHIDKKFKNRMLLAEANQWPEDAATYFGNGDECHMAFHFPVMPRLFMAIRMEDSFPILDILEQSANIPENCQWAMFLRNHDELTLEMVTDEERDYMYRSYAQDPRSRINLGIRRRLAPLLQNNRRKIELMNTLLFSLPGTPVLYYGDEIGMGDNYYLGDRDGVRTPMQWSPDRNAGFSKANPHKLYLPVVIEAEYHYAAVNVENQNRNPSSLLWWTKRMLAMRKRYQAFGRGNIEFLQPDNPKVLIFLRRYQDQTILVVANLSRFSQVAQLDLSGYNGYIPEEVFSGNQFPEITEAPYTFTLGPHNYYWFSLQKQAEPIPTEEKMPTLQFETTWRNLPNSEKIDQLSKTLKNYLKTCRWFGGKGTPLRRIRIAQAVTLSSEQSVAHLLIMKVYYTGAPQETYLLPISATTHESAVKIIKEYPQSVIANIETKDLEGVIYDGVYNTELHNLLLDTMAARKRRRSGKNKIIGYRNKKFRQHLGNAKLLLESHVLNAEQSNTSILYDNTFFLKLYRRLEEGTNPDVEISRYLTEKTNFENFPAFLGSLEFRSDSGKPITIGMLSPFIANQQNAWEYTLDAVENYFGRTLTSNNNEITPERHPDTIMQVTPESIPDYMRDLIGPVYLEMVSLLAKRTAQMHLALSSLSGNNDVEPEQFSMLYQRAVYQSMRGLTRKVFSQTRKNIKNLSESQQTEAQTIADSEKTVLDRLKQILKKKISAMKIRIHGDYHLGQVLYTGKDFVIIDFEGEPARPLSERRLKRSALRDVAGMVRSFHYAAYGGIYLRGSTISEDPQTLEKLAETWYFYVSGMFLNSYLKTVGEAPILPGDPKDFKILFEAFLLEKAVYELGYELNNRPDWLTIPARGINQILQGNI